VFCGGCLVLEGQSYADDELLPGRVASDPAVAQWPLIVLHDSVVLDQHFGIAQMPPDIGIVDGAVVNSEPDRVKRDRRQNKGAEKRRRPF